MNKKGMIVAFSICIAIVAGLIATIIVLASGTQGVGTSVSVLYVATDIEGTVSARYSKVNKNTSAVISTTDMVTSSGSKTVSFLSTAPTTTNLLNPTESSIALTDEQDLIITYTFTAVETYYATLEYKDNSTSASNIEFSYALNDGAYNPKMSMPIEVTPDKSTTYSIKFHIANTALNANLSGSLNWALTKDGGKTPSGSDEKVAISFANSSGNCKINSANCAVVYNSDKSKFKITGITPTISNGSVTNLADLTNSNGSEFYYFATNSAVVGTTGYTDPGTTYYISGLGTSANPACESWYDTPTDSTTLYATFMTPTHTSEPTTDGELSGEVIFGHSITSLHYVGYATFSIAVVPNSITTIDGGANYTSLTQNKRNTNILFTVSDPVPYGTSIFFYSNNLKNVELPNSINVIGEHHFTGCTSLTKITMPDSVTSIDQCAFKGCTSLVSIAVWASNPTYYSSNNCIIKKSDKSLIKGCKTSVIPNGVTSIVDHAFYGCSGLTSITIPDSVTSIGWFAFNDCSELTSVTFADTSKTWTIKDGSTIKASDVSVADPTQNATYLVTTYRSYCDWTKNS